MKGSNRMVPFWEMRTCLLTMLDSVGRLDCSGVRQGEAKKTDDGEGGDGGEHLCGHGGSRQAGDAWGDAGGDAAYKGGTKS